MVKTMSDMAMKYEDWLRGCVHHDGRKGNVYLPCDMVLAIADWIEAHRDVAPIRRGHWIYDCCDIVCSECGTAFSDEICYMMRSNTSYHEPKYCLWCGAEMSEDTEY